MSSMTTLILPGDASATYLVPMSCAWFTQLHCICTQTVQIFSLWDSLAVCPLHIH